MLFIHVIAKFLPESVSDHCPCVISFESDDVIKPKAFKFFNMWTKAEEFMGKVQEV